jgi:3-oxoacyl-[acyl-carrier-protein] synthase II
LTKRRVVITGLGLISPLGLNVKESWKKILAGQSGIELVTNFSTEEINSKIAGTVKGFTASDYIPAKDIKKIDPFIHYAVAASEEAMADSGLDLSKEDVNRIGVSIGSGIGGLSTIEKNTELLIERGPKKISPFFIPGSIINMASGYVSIHFGVKGPNFSIVTACTSGAHSIGYSARTIAYGDADIMIAGGAEMANCRMGLGGFAALRAVSTRNDSPNTASRPWDKDRDGFVLGEGAGILILEEYEHAKARGAKIYAELTGFGLSADAIHMTMNDQTGEAPSLCINNALQDAKLNPEQIDYVNAHATSTPVGDPAEVKALKLSFKDHAYQFAVSSTKSMTGHLLGAAGAIEAVFSVLALQDNIAPPTINLEQPDDECDLDFVPNEARDLKINHVLSNSFAFGGANGALIFSRVE